MVTRDDTVETDMGGDPACWLHQVCDRCGALVEGEAGHDCAPRPAISVEVADS